MLHSFSEIPKHVETGSNISYRYDPQTMLLVIPKHIHPQLKYLHVSEEEQNKQLIS